MKKIISLLLCIAAILSLASCSLGKSDDSDGKNDGPDPDAVVMKTENFSISFAELNYIFYKQYNQFVQSYANQIGDNYASVLKSYFGLDINSPLKDQMLPDQSDNFLNYFLTSAKSEATDILIFCEYAKENGLDITDEDKESIESSLKEYESAAVEQKVTLAEYIGDKAGLTTSDVMRSYAEKNALASNGYNHQHDSHTYTDEQITKEFNDNPEKYAMVTYLAYTIQPNDGSLTADNVKSYSDELAATTDEASFTAYVENFHKNVLYEGAAEVPEFDPATLKYKNIKYNEGTDYLEWMFSDAKPGETHVISDDTTHAYTVYMLLSEPGENEYDLKNVRHILFLSSSFNSTEECRKKAEEIYTLYKNDPTEDNFAALATKYSEDGGSKDNGGLYENVDYNQMVADFENWTFDPSRQPGDTGIVLTSYGYHVMYFSGNGKHVKKGFDAAKQGLVDADYEVDHKALVEKYKITSDDEVINQFSA